MGDPDRTPSRHRDRHRYRPRTERPERARRNGIQTIALNNHARDLGEIVRGSHQRARRGRRNRRCRYGSSRLAGGQACPPLTSLLPDSLAAKLMTTAGTDRLAALHTAIDLVRRGGTISLSGVYGGMADPCRC